jgi:V8-like Glu-specific endopeptidase
MIRFTGAPRVLAALLVCCGLLAALPLPTVAQGPPALGPFSPSDPRAQLGPSWVNVPAKPLPGPPVRRKAVRKAPLFPVRYEIGTGTVSREPLIRGKRLREDVVTGAPGVVPPAGAPELLLSPQTVFGRDNRRLVTDTTVYPFSTNCSLLMLFPSGNAFIGSATMVSRRFAVTAGHCVYDAGEGGWATAIQVVPGRDGSFAPFGVLSATNLFAWNAWINNASFDWDIGLIQLNQDVGTATGYQGFASYRKVKGLKAHTAGYPGDRDSGTRQYYSKGKTGRSSDHQFLFKFDVMQGQSGSGIFKSTRSGPFVR